MATTGPAFLTHFDDSVETKNLNLMKQKSHASFFGVVFGCKTKLQEMDIAIDQREDE